MSASPLTPGATRDLLASLGHRPRSSLGQNFLVDGNIVRKSLTLARITPGDVVVEVGPGLGTLTRALLDAGATVYAIELDRTLHAHLETTLVPAFAGRLHLMQGDAVDFPRAGLPPEIAAKGAWKVVANLPYAISSPWLEGVLDGPLPERMVLMLQKEAADRYTASHGTKSFGALSVFAQAAFAREPGHPVSRSCFSPVPDIDSVLLHLARRDDARPLGREARRLIRALFTQRRKQVGALARREPALAAWREWLPLHGYTLESRPEDLPLEAWHGLEASLQ